MQSAGRRLHKPRLGHLEVSSSVGDTKNICYWTKNHLKLLLSEQLWYKLVIVANLKHLSGKKTGGTENTKMLNGMLICLVYLMTETLYTIWVGQ